MPVKQVDASTVTAVQLIGSNRFVIPDFQREYSWEVESQVTDFWKDLHGSIVAGDYFLGLLIFTDGPTHKEIVDGQQRLLTLTLLANAIRLAARREKRKIVAENVRNTFLYSVDFLTEEEYLRTTPTDLTDERDLRLLLEAEAEDQIPQGRTSGLFKAHYYLSRMLKEDLEEAETSTIRLGQWAEFISQSITFAVFVHPDRAAAFRVYEVINTRGKDLTPSELIKSHLIGSSSEERHLDTYRRWKQVEARFEELGAPNQVTTFIRHVVTLIRGYVIPRELYRVVSEGFQGDTGVAELLTSLELHLPTYAQMVDPSGDFETSEVSTRSYAMLSALSGARFRPIFLEAAQHPSSDELMQELLAILIPGILAGRFSTGGVEAQFHRSARRLHRTGDWDHELSQLAELRPTPQDFQGRISRNLNRDHALVIRAAVLQSSALPSLDGFIHQVRPRQAEWPGFDDKEYKEIGATLGNLILLDVARRPNGTRNPESVAERLIPHALADEIIDPSKVSSWTAAFVASETQRLADRATEIWYDGR